MTFEKFFFVYLFDISLDPLSKKKKKKKKFVVFLGQSIKGFLPNPRLKHFCPFFFIILHVFMHFFFLGDFCTFQNLAFLIFSGFLIKTKSWVFVHASYKHDSHALIENFEIRVLMFLRDFGIL